MKRLLRWGGILALLFVLAQGVGVGVLWWQGKLMPERLTQMKELLMTGAATAVEAEAPTKVILPSDADITRERSLRVLALAEREAILQAIQGLIETRADELRANRAEFEAERTAFQERIDEERQKATDAGTEQIRTILQKMPPAGAAASLMPMTTPQMLRVVRGLPEATIARIIQELQKGNVEEQKRAVDIVDGLGKGEPINSLLDSPRPQATQAANPR